MLETKKQKKTKQNKKGDDDHYGSRPSRLKSQLVVWQAPGNPHITHLRASGRIDPPGSPGLTLSLHPGKD